MKMKVCTVKDRALDAFLRPFYAQTTAHAIRVFMDGVAQQDTEMHAHPEDYDLFHIAEWDDHTGVTTNLPDGPIMLCRGKDAAAASNSGKDPNQQEFAYTRQHLNNSKIESRN